MKTSAMRVIGSRLNWQPSPRYRSPARRTASPAARRFVAARHCVAARRSAVPAMRRERRFSVAIFPQLLALVSDVLTETARKTTADARKGRWVERRNAPWWDRARLACATPLLERGCEAGRRALSEERQFGEP